MAVELMGAKLVAPFYGNSLYVWTAVLTITVLGLTLGYYAGGQFVKKRPSETKLFLVLGISALLVLALPQTASLAIALTKGMELLPGICVTCMLLLLPPMLCFGIVGPMVVSLMSSPLETIGKTAGTVYFTSTLGGIAATFFLGLYFIPVAGLRLCATITSRRGCWLAQADRDQPSRLQPSAQRLQPTNQHPKAGADCWAKR